MALEEHFRDDDEGPVSNQGYMPYLNKFILEKVSFEFSCSVLSCISFCCWSVLAVAGACRRLLLVWRHWLRGFLCLWGHHGAATLESLCLKMERCNVFYLFSPWFLFPVTSGPCLSCVHAHINKASQLELIWKCLGATGCPILYCSYNRILSQTLQTERAKISSLFVTRYFNK